MKNPAVSVLSGSPVFVPFGIASHVSRFALHILPYSRTKFARVAPIASIVDLAFQRSWPL